MKTKASVSLSHDLLEEEEAAQTSRSRNQIFEIWLRLAKRRRAAEKLERDMLAYYAGRIAEQAAEDEALSRASLRAARKRRIDGARPRSCARRRCNAVRHLSQRQQSPVRRKWHRLAK